MGLVDVKVWDIRMFKPVNEYFTATPSVSMDISQRGMLAVGYGSHVQVNTNSSLYETLNPKPLNHNDYFLPHSRSSRRGLQAKQASDQHDPTPNLKP